jgi:hypothetical protein
VKNRWNTKKNTPQAGEQARNLLICLFSHPSTPEPQQLPNKPTNFVDIMLSWACHFTPEYQIS